MASQPISICQNLVALLQNGVAEKNRRQNSNLELERCDSAKRTCELPYPRSQNTENIVVEN
jgi:hypothetical protein